MEQTQNWILKVVFYSELAVLRRKWIKTWKELHLQDNGYRESCTERQLINLLFFPFILWTSRLSLVSASVSLELLQDHWIWGQGAVQKRTTHYSVHMLSCEQRLCVNSFLQHGAQMCPYSMDCSSSLILPSYSVTWICLHVFLFCCSHQNHSLGSMFLWSYTEVIWWGRSQRRLLTLPLFSKGLCFWFYWENGSQCPSKPLTDPPPPPATYKYISACTSVPFILSQEEASFLLKRAIVDI